MGIYTVTFDILGIFSGGVPQLTSLYGDVEMSTDYAYTGETSVSFEINTDTTPFYSTLLRFYFDDDANGTSGDSIQINNLKIDGVDVGSGSQSVSYGGAFDIDVVSYIPDTQFGAPGTNPTPQAVITGTAGDDYLEGTAGADTIDGLAGHDRINTGSGGGTVNAGDGNDRVVGGSGDDNLNGDADNDSIWGGAGNDTINGGTGNDSLYGMSGTNTINGGAGTDRIDGGINNDTLNGDADADRIYGGLGDDTINGGTGNDRLAGNDGVDTIHGNEDNDDIRGGDGNDILFGDDGDDNIDGQNDDDTISGGLGDDTISGDRGNDTIDGDENNDYLNGGQGADTLSGGTGDDIIYGGGMQTYDQYNIRAASAFGATGVWFNEQTQSFYRYVNTNVDYATADAAAQAAILNGVAGHLVTISSQVENDYVQTLVGADTWLGGTDTGTEGQWTWNGGASGGVQFSDAVGTSVNNMYENWNGGEPNDSGAGEDHSELRNSDGLWNDLDGTSSTNHYVIEWDAEDVMADNSIDTLNGGDGDDQLYGGGGDDTINGDANNDILYGGAGNDTLNGGTGNDALYGQTGNDILNGGTGADTINGDTATQVVGQSGQVTTNQTGSAQWHTVTFDATILNPVIKLAINTTNDTDPMTLRVQNVTDTGFEWQIDEYEYLDGVHGSETVSWMAIATGTHTLDDGTIIQANTTTATNNNWTNVTFNSAFGSSPVIMTQIMTTNDGTAAVLHNENRTTTGFRLQIEEQESFGTTHATETIGWIAIDNGGSVANGLLVGETSNSVRDNTATIDFGSDFASNTPVVLIDMQTEDGGDTAMARGITISSSGITLNIDEEQSNNSETAHTTEVVGYYATTAGLIYANGDNGTDTISGGSGLDTLYGGDGADSFVFEAASAYLETDVIQDFHYAQGDALDISDLITGFSGTITDYIQFVKSGTDTIVQVDGNGLTGGSSFSTIALLDGVTDLDETLLYAAGGIVV